MKSKNIYVCTNCGHSEAKWAGKCPDCGMWNTLEEQAAIAPSKSGAAPRTNAVKSDAVPITDVEFSTEPRFSSGITELDRVLGGGIVQGSLVLVGGEPGIGKSTLLLQICNSVPGQILYVSGEESPSQIKLRANRLGVLNKSMSLLCDTELENISAVLENKRPKVAVIDSIQTITSSLLSSAPGTASQIREVTMSLMKIAKSLNITIFIVGHVTKDGNIAGPKILEHMVDCVLYFEGESTHTFRLLRAVKNRFGSTNEAGIFEMTETGLECVINPSAALLTENQFKSSGTCITCTMEGTRPILSEVQALVTPTFFPIPRRTASGVDYNRFTLLLAVLEKRAGLKICNYDAYINIAGGMKLTEPSSDLAVALSVYSNYKDIIIDNSTVAFGEIGLLGEVRSVPMTETRITECKKLGYKKIIVPYTNYIKLKDKEGVVGVRSLGEAFKTLS